MPIYDYDCAGCGRFTAMQPMARYRDPLACPNCGAAASRTLTSAPGIAGENTALERTAGPPRPSAPAHPAGCGCCTRRWPLPSGLSAKTGRVFVSNGPTRRGGF